MFPRDLTFFHNVIRQLLDSKKGQTARVKNLRRKSAVRSPVVNPEIKTHNAVKR